MIGQQKLFYRFTASQILVMGFAGTILIGALLLSLPISTEDGQSVSFIDALFTATSAVCVTGLVVVNTAATYNTFGEGVILTLIQVGGLGFMSFATLIAVLLRKKISVKERIVIQESFGHHGMGGMVRLVLNVVVITFIIEGIGALLLALRWVPMYGWKTGIYYSIFHSVSSFNNAGFDLFGGKDRFVSLMGFVGDPLINFTVATLIILGGIGFIVIVELYQYRWRKRMSLHTKLVLSVTGILLAAGTLLILLIEWSNPKTLGSQPWPVKMMAAAFQSVTPRTAGYNTIDMASMYPATQFLMILLMVIGASPSSTGGGIKTTTFAAIILAVWGMIRGHQDCVTYKRRIPHEQVYRALTVTVAALTLIITVTMILTITEKTDVLMALFETSSAFGTVGLTLGLTPHLSVVGKLLITFTMFAGRVGPLTIAIAVASRRDKPPYRHPEEQPLVG
jgi:trk system potassium uptake protein